MHQVLQNGSASCTWKSMFRIAKGYEHVTKTIRIPRPTAEKLEKLSTENDISLNQLINQCIQFALENQDEPEHQEESLCSEKR